MEPSPPFAGLASLYAHARPHYDAAVADATLDGLAPPVTAIDLGCGTGLFTRTLRPASGRVVPRQGLPRVVGVDLDLGMLRRARAEVAAVDGWVAATCARLPFATGGLDLVTCAQSFHWFDDVEGQAEIARVLRPAGRLALVWNVRRQETAMDRAYAAVARRAQEAAAAAGRTVHSARTPRDLDAALFTVERRLELANPQRVDRDGLVARAESASYFPRAGALKAQLIAELEEAFDRHAVNGAIALSQVTELTVARRQ